MKFLEETFSDILSTSFQERVSLTYIECQVEGDADTEGDVVGSSKF